MHGPSQYLFDCIYLVNIYGSTLFIIVLCKTTACATISVSPSLPLVQVEEGLERSMEKMQSDLCQDEFQQQNETLQKRVTELEAQTVQAEQTALMAQQQQQERDRSRLQLRATLESCQLELEQVKKDKEKIEATACLCREANIAQVKELELAVKAAAADAEQLRLELDSERVRTRSAEQRKAEFSRELSRLQVTLVSYLSHLSA